jgi:hypothetical protein
VESLLHKRLQSIGVIDNECNDFLVIMIRCRDAGDGRRASHSAVCSRAIFLPSEFRFGLPGGDQLANWCKGDTQDFDDEIAARLPRQVDRLIAVDSNRRIACGFYLVSEGIDRCRCREPFRRPYGYHDRHRRIHYSLRRVSFLWTEANLIEFSPPWVAGYEDVVGLNQVAKHFGDQRWQKRGVGMVGRCGCRLVRLEQTAQGVAAGPKASDCTIFNALGRSR